MTRHPITLARDRHTGRLSRSSPSAAAGVLLGLMLLGSGCSEPLDEQGCPETPAREVVLLFDASNPLTPIHESEIRQIMEEMLDPQRSARHTRLAIRKKERFTAYSLGSSVRDIRYIESMCSPGDPANRSILENLTSSSVIAQARWETFQNAVRGVLEGVFPPTPSEHDHSPLLETVAVITPRHADSVRSDRRRMHLIIVSDLLQHTESLSHYLRYLPAQQVPEALHTDLSRVDVTLFRLDREEERHSRHQTPEHFYWWTDFVEAMGGEVVWQQPL